MALEDIGVQVGNFTGAHGFQEIGEVAFVLALEGANELAFQIKQRTPGNDPILAIENPTALEIPIERFGLQPARLRDDGFVAKVVDTDLRVGRLAGVCVPETSSVINDGAAQARDAQPPAANIDGVNVVVSQLAVARLPEPMPVIMKIRAGQRTHRRRTGEEVVIDARRNLVVAW